MDAPPSSACHACCRRPHASRPARRMPHTHARTQAEKTWHRCLTHPSPCVHAAAPPCRTAPMRPCPRPSSLQRSAAQGGTRLSMHACRPAASAHMAGMARGICATPRSHSHVAPRGPGLACAGWAARPSHLPVKALMPHGTTLGCAMGAKALRLRYVAAGARRPSASVP